MEHRQPVCFGTVFVVVVVVVVVLKSSHCSALQSDWLILETAEFSYMKTFPRRAMPLG